MRVCVIKCPQILWYLQTLGVTLSTVCAHLNLNIIIYIYVVPYICITILHISISICAVLLSFFLSVKIHNLLIQSNSKWSECYKYPNSTRCLCLYCILRVWTDLLIFQSRFKYSCRHTYIKVIYCFSPPFTNQISTPIRFMV